MANDFQIGDKVKVRPHPSWTQPTKGWADRGRVATVHNVFVPHGATKARIAIKFDTQRTDRLEYFDEGDLLPVEIDNGQ